MRLTQLRQEDEGLIALNREIFVPTGWRHETPRGKQRDLLRPCTHTDATADIHALRIGFIAIGGKSAVWCTHIQANLVAALGDTHAVIGCPIAIGITNGARCGIAWELNTVCCATGTLATYTKRTRRLRSSR